MTESSGMADFAKWKREFRVSLGVEVTKKTNAREAIKGLPYFSSLPRNGFRASALIPCFVLPWGEGHK